MNNKLVWLVVIGAILLLSKPKKKASSLSGLRRRKRKSIGMAGSVNSLDFRIKNEILNALVESKRYDRTMYVVYDDDNGWIASEIPPEKRQAFYRVDGRRNHVDYVNRSGNTERIEGKLIRKGVTGGSATFNLSGIADKAIAWAEKKSYHSIPYEYEFIVSKKKDGISDEDIYKELAINYKDFPIVHQKDVSEFLNLLLTYYYTKVGHTPQMKTIEKKYYPSVTSEKKIKEKGEQMTLFGLGRIDNCYKYLTMRGFGPTEACFHGESTYGKGTATFTATDKDGRIVPSMSIEKVMTFDKFYDMMEKNKAKRVS